MLGQPGASPHGCAREDRVLGQARGPAIALGLGGPRGLPGLVGGWGHVGTGRSPVGRNCPFGPPLLPREDVTKWREGGTLTV